MDIGHVLRGDIKIAQAAHIQNGIAGVTGDGIDAAVNPERISYRHSPVNREWEKEQVWRNPLQWEKDVIDCYKLRNL